MNTSIAIRTNPDSSAASMTSLEIAELVEARHDSVKRAVERLATRTVITLPPLVEKPTSGRPSTFYVFEGEQGKRDSYVVVAQLSPEFTARLVDRWQELEGKINQPSLPENYIESLEALLESKKAEQLAISQRDQAIATKAQISSSREASVMGKLSAASRKMQKLEQELGRNSTEATMTAVEKAMGQKYGKQGFRPLKKWCKDNGITPSKVPCPRYGEVVAWPAQAWFECYGVVLSELFGREAAA